MSATQKFFRFVFGLTGTRAAVPDPVQGDGSVSYQDGYGLDYQRQKTDPLSKNIERDKMNQLFYDLTLGLQQYQTHGAPEFITAADNGGAAYSYGAGAVVLYTDGKYYRSIVAANTSDPTDTSKWALIPSSPALKVITANTALTADDAGVVLINAAGGNVVITMPAATASPRARFTLRRIDASVVNTVTVNRVGADTFEGLGAATFQLTGPYASRDLQSDGVSVWRSPMLYESGSFVPTARGTGTTGVFTYNTQLGSFTRIGNRVFFELNIGWTATTGTGSLRVTSIPYNVGAVQGFACSVRYDNLTLGAGKQLTAHVTQTNNEIVLQAGDPAGGAAIDVPVDPAVGNLMIAGSYVIA